jgi:lipoate-protein ligase A
MSSEVACRAVVERRRETSLPISVVNGQTSSNRFLDFTRNDKTLEMTKGTFAVLDVYQDDASRSAAMNMAIDEALLGMAEGPSIRFYRWNSPALSFGYFGKFADVADYAAKRDLVRRWTGGGIVLHGDDLTYSIIIPARDPLFAESSTSIYEKIHRAISNVLRATGAKAELAAVATVSDRRYQIISAVGDCRYNGACFANPVHADVLVNGRKVAGAGQRRTRAGLLHQGSIQHVDLAEGFDLRFARALGDDCVERELNSGMVERAVEISAQKYATQGWLQRR